MKRSTEITRKMLALAAPYKRDLSIAAAASLTLVAAEVVTPWILRDLTTRLEVRGETVTVGLLARFAVMLVGAYLIQALCRFCSNYPAHRAAWRLVPRLRSDLYNHMQNLSPGFFASQQTGQLMSRVVNDTDKLEQLLAHIIPQMASSALTFAAVLTLLLIIDPFLTLLVFLPMPVLGAGGWIFVKKIRPMFARAQGFLGDFNGALQENLSGVKEIQSFGQQDGEYGKISRLAAVYSNQILRALRTSALFHSSSGFLTSAVEVIVVVYGGWMAVQGRMAIGDILAFVLYLNLFYQPIKTVAQLLEDFQSAYAGAERVFEIMDTPGDVQDAPDAKPLPPAVKGDIRLDAVSFNYEAGEQHVLKSVDLEIPAKSVTAIVGPTGVGKTTVINLLMRFYDPTGGRVLIDGHDIKHVTLESLRRNVSVVMQDIFLFNGTVMENIRYSKPDASEDEIIGAARAAHIHDFIIGLPGGYGTVVGERGLRLSGGQKQRLSIARAILRDCPILILDEATSAVDAETEAHIQMAIDGLAGGGGRTIIVVAHRLSTVRRADRIIVLEDGLVIQQGSHDELIKQDGLYKTLCENQ